jgi:hypothetical protein
MQSIFFIISFYISTSLASIFKDLSWDGRQYHSEAITQLYLGWNPFTEIISPEIWDTTFALWLNTLPKFPWILEFFSFLVFYDIEKAKYLSFLCIILLSVISFQLIKNLVSNLYFRIYISILISLNPILISQSSSKYLDGFSGFWTISLILIILFDSSTNPLKKDKNYMRLVSLTVLLVSGLGIITKFSQILPIFLLDILFMYQNKFFIGKIFKISKIKFSTFSLLFSGIVLTIFLLVNPLFNNLFKYGNFFYPMSSKNYLKFIGLGTENFLNPNFKLSDIIYLPHTPEILTSNPWFIRPFLSLFLQPAHSSSIIPANFKSIFSFSLSEYSYLGNPDGRVSAFGSLFALALILALMTFLISKPKSSAILLTFVMLISFSLTPYAWWFRYVSWFYILPIILLLLINLRNKVVILGVFATTVILTLNSSILIREVIKFRVEEQNQEISKLQKIDNILIMDHYWNGDRINKVINGEKFIFDNLENSFFQNHVKPKYSDVDLNVLYNCYRPREPEELKIWRTENGLYPIISENNEIIIPNFPLNLSLDTCDVRSLSEIQSSEKFLRLTTISLYFPN